MAGVGLLKLPTMTKIIAVDDHNLIRIGYRRIFEDYSDFHFAGDAGSGDDLFSLLAATSADVVLLGVNPLDTMDCVGITRRLRREYPAVKIFALGNEGAVGTVNKMMKAGMNGFMGKRQVCQENLAAAIEQVMKGEKVVGKIDSK
jgi:two-component system invasion response regulator UvrY